MPVPPSWTDGWTNEWDVGASTASTTLYYAEASASTTLPWQDWTTTTSGMMNQFIMSIDDVLKDMRRFQGFRDNNLFWFNHIRAGAARRLSMLCLQAVREDQRSKTPRLRVREHKMMFKPRATSCRKWTTGRPRK